MLHIVLYNPEIPQNTGNIGRLCAISDLRLHLIRPLGFTLNDKYLRRSGMAYWQSLDKHIHNDWESFISSPFAPKRLWLFTTKAKSLYWDVAYRDGDGLVDGVETNTGTLVDEENTGTDPNNACLLYTSPSPRD